MSLQVWLPLVKDFENYGVSGLKFQNFRYIRFVVNAIRDSGKQTITQLSRLEFLDANGNLYKYPSGTTVSTSMTGYAAHEPPASVIDGNVNTKFCTTWTAGGHFTIALGSGETIDISRYSRFQWYTANDAEWRDPISFEVQFSNDGSNFVKGAVVTNASITSTRYALAYTGNCFSASAGKIGSSCYYNNSYELGGLYSDKKINLGNKLSMCCWVKFSALTPDFGLGGSMGGQHRYPNCTGMGLTLKHVSGSTGYLSCNTGDGNGNRTFNTYCGNTLLSANTWYHVAFTYDGSTIKFYVNGNLDGTHSYAAQKNVEDYVFIGAWSFEYSSDSPTIYGQYKLNGNMNDFRIYDHVLSKKEIKEISKGLVAHYQLKGMGATNYLKGAGKFLKDTPLVRNANDVSHMNDSYVYHEWSPNDLFAVLPSAGTYTFSAECDGIGTGHPTSGTTASQRLFSLWLQNTSTGTHYHFAMSKGADGRWYGTLTNLVAGTYKVRTNLYAADNINYTLKFWNMKVTAGSYNPSDTWCPHEEDELYNSLNLGSAIGTDCSGYGNNLERVGTIPIENGSARFGSCANYNNSGYLRKSNFNMITNQFTIAFWINPPYSINAQHFICGTFNNWTGNGFGMWRDSTGGGYSALYRSNNEGSHTGLPGFTPSHDTWNHVAYVYTGTQGIYYKNGVEVERANGGSSGTVSHPVLYLGNSMFNGEPVSEIDQASMSDFRFYATALSASDIADLYKNSASLTKDGKLMAYDFHENKRNTIDKDGVVATGGFNVKAIPTYDMKVKALPDGSTWARIHHLDVSNDKTFFANASEVAKCLDKHNRYSRMGIVDKYKVGSEYEFMLTYPSIKKTLPSGYTQLDYIEATGTQWINTGVTGHARWEFDIQFTNTTKRQLMGYWGSGDEYWGCQTDGKYGLFAGSTIGIAGGRDTIVHDYQSGAASLWVQNQTWGIGGSANIGSNQYQIFNIMGVADYTCHAKLWRCKCIQGNTLIRDFIPAQRNSDGYVGLYDIVNNVFYGNSGSGSFTAGSSIAGGGYQWLDYIESTGTQYIDTGFKHNQNTRVVMDVQATSITANAWAFEGRISNDSAAKGIFFFYGHDKLWNVDYSSYVNRSAFSGIGSTNRLAIDYNKNTVTINGITKTFTANTFQSTCNLTLLAANTNGSVSGHLSARLYSCKIYDNGTLIRDFVPCINPSGIVGLYDKANGRFYGNSGSGSFRAGTVTNQIQWSIESYNRWIQNSLTTDVNQGDNISFKPIFSSWPQHLGPLKPANSSVDTVYDCDNKGTGNWYAPVGQLRIWEGGIPSADGSAQLETELWVRVDRFSDTNKLQIYDGCITAKDFMEL